MCLGYRPQYLLVKIDHAASDDEIGCRLLHLKRKFGID